ncbi:glucose-6-phosphate 1-dehydrogenase [Tersicoccus solisilvae]|uniref:Glucose-6-phosphate 1-dehydrogenase n=1 Tax=Tersicoccus solisilvae TaxID=1882339 RepID=A0ABQ1P5H6_9MICC|nr:glucose-6-phosphate dehydrogenase [Tersicoccus solisilvae]GGC90996.1 glucose-6-phosphate 1-dehydrogenase [Tersicoccus solisilvae]
MAQSIDTLVIVGVTGDLSSRLLLPALGQLLTREKKRKLRLIGVGTEDWDDAKLAQTLKASFETSSAKGAAVTDLIKHATYVRADVTDRDDVQRLVDGLTGTPAFYFALPPAITAQCCALFEQTGLPDGTVLALEKPFGTDEKSARALNEQLARLVPEERVFRVDHFLGKSTVLNLLGLRFANRVFEPLWNREHIEKIDIVYDEQLGLEGRARYYDTAGAMVDMIQSHLLQVLAVVTMEAPATLDHEDVRAATATALRATHVFGGDPVASSRRARYTAGKIGRRTLPAYKDESGVDPAHHTETLAELTVEVQNWRWSGVPLTMRSGKALAAKRSEIVITFRPVPEVPTGFGGDRPANVLRLSMGPDRMELNVNINGPGDPLVLDQAVFTAEFGEGELLAYGEVLSGLLDADPMLSIRGDAAEECWRIVDAVRAAWKDDAVPLQSYPAGSKGPATWTPLG